MNTLDKNKIARNLSRMIQIDTVQNGSLSQYKKFRELLKELYPNVFEIGEIIPIENALLIKIEGRNNRANKPMLIMSHTDVVEADGEWSYPPFSGEIADGCVWGRGTVDTKGSLCAFFEATENLLRTRFRPEADLYLASSIDEETLGVGARNVASYFKKEDIELGVVLDEGGAIVDSPMPGLNGYFAMIGIMEKGYANIEFIAKSKGGHASTPDKDTPITRLSAFVNEINTNSPFKKKLTPPVKEMFKDMSKHMSQPYKFIFRNTTLLSPVLLNILPKVSSQANAMLTTTCAFTMANGSQAPNIVPESASVTANLRFMSHQPMHESLRLIKKIADKYDLEMNILYAHDCSAATSTSRKNYKYTCDCVRNVFSNVVPAPYIMLGATDSRHFTDVSPCVLRFSPLKLNKQQLNSPHGVDENVSIDALYDAVRFYRYFIENFEV